MRNYFELIIFWLIYTLFFCSFFLSTISHHEMIFQKQLRNIFCSVSQKISDFSIVVQKYSSGSIQFMSSSKIGFGRVVKL